MGKTSRRKPPSQGAQAYEAPTLFVGFFYVLLVAWTIVSVVLITSKVRGAGGGDLLWLFMIAFVLAYSWYFSLRIAYRLEMGPDETLRLTSYGRVLDLVPRQIQGLEGPALPIGFLRFRLEREKAYLFCVATDRELQGVLRRIVEANPDIKVKTR